DQLGGLVLLERGLRMGMDTMAPFSHLGVEVGDSIDDRHNLGSPVRFGGACRCWINVSMISQISGMDTIECIRGVKFGPTVAVFRGEAKLAYDHSAQSCTIQGRGIDGRGASRANASGTVEASGGDTTLLKVEGQFNVTGPLETFANAGGVHLARAILAEFAENVAKLITEQGRPPPPGLDPLTPGGERAAPLPTDEQLSAPAAAELKGGKVLWRAFVSWLRE